jgi:hypothetical protein
MEETEGWLTSRPERTLTFPAGQIVVTSDERI